MPFIMFDRWFLIVFIPLMLLSVVVQNWVRNRFIKYSRVPAQTGLSTLQVVQQILRNNDITDLRIERVPGFLTDHYSPREKTLRLSDSSYNQNSVAAIAVAAHEAGHAVQDKKRYLPNLMRDALVPIARLASMAGPYLLMFGFFMQAPMLVKIGVWAYFAALLFYLITLPVEFDASRRAMKSLRGLGILSEAELSDARKVLTAAAMTYVVSALTAFATFMRFFSLTRSRD